MFKTMFRSFLIGLFLVGLVVLSLYTPAASAPKHIDACKAELPYGVPSSSKESTVQLCRIGYALEYDLQSKIPVWVGYVLTPEEAVGCFPRTANFSIDYSLPHGSRSTIKDYKHSGYDTGHMVNDADLRWDSIAGDESLLLSNMTPQLPGFNRGIWKKLEDSTRGWALSRQSPIMVYAGPIYGPDDKTIGAGVKIPASFFKVLIDTKTHEAQVYLFKHEATTYPLSDFLSTLEEVQSLSGVRLPLPTAVRVTSKGWPRHIKSNKRAKDIACDVK